MTGKVRILPPPPIKPKLTPINIEALKPTISVEFIFFYSDFVNNTTKVSWAKSVFRDNCYIATKFHDFCQFIFEDKKSLEYYFKAISNNSILFRESFTRPRRSSCFKSRETTSREVANSLPNSS